MFAFKLRILRKPSVQEKCAGRDGARRILTNSKYGGQAMRVISVFFKR
jgi:hypothetical protein